MIDSKFDIEGLCYSPNDWEDWTCPPQYYKTDFSDPYWYVLKYRRANRIVK